LLRRGLIVAVTGSKFFAGPPFSGALLLPPTILARVARWSLPAGLAEHSSRLDWPSDLQGRIPMAWTNEVNFGLGLRWIAALSEMERFFAIDAKNRARILDLFENEIRTGAARVARLEEWRDTSSARDASPPSILSFVMSHPEGTPHSFEETAAIHARLRSPGDASGKPSPAEIFHLGQPVRIGPSAALRVCISAPMISDVADLMKDGADLETAFLPWRERLRALFDKWGGLIGSVTPMSSTPNA
jgi:hypothetical protein